MKGSRKSLTSIFPNSPRELLKAHFELELKEMIGGN